MTTLDIVIVNWNAGDLLRRCVDSIRVARAGIERLRIIVVDNASTDGSVDRLDSGDLQVEVIRNSVNRGFAAACNQGALGSRAEFVLFLNPDTELHERSLTTPAAFLEHPDNTHVGIVGIQLLDVNGMLAKSCCRFPSPLGYVAQAAGLDRFAPSLGGVMRDFDHKTTRVVDQVIGAFFFVRRSLFEDLGGFDERFFVYFEELDFSLRAMQQGYRSVYLADASAVHVGCGTTDQVKALRLFFNLRSRLVYATKHFTRPGRLAVAATTLVLEPVTRVTYAALRRQALGDVYRGYRLLWGAAPHVLRSSD